LKQIFCAASTAANDTRRHIIQRVSIGPKRCAEGAWTEGATEVPRPAVAVGIRNQRIARQTEVNDVVILGGAWTSRIIEAEEQVSRTCLGRGNACQTEGD
jgi:hypothetical protein